MQPSTHVHAAAVALVASCGVSQSGKASLNKIMRHSGLKRGDGEGSMKGKAGDGWRCELVEQEGQVSSKNNLYKLKGSVCGGARV